MCYQELWTGQQVLQEESIGYCTMHIVMFQYSPDGTVETGNIRSGPWEIRATSEHNGLVSGCCIQTHIITLTTSGQQLVTELLY